MMFLLIKIREFPGQQPARRQSACGDLPHDQVAVGGFQMGDQDLGRAREPCEFTLQGGRAQVLRDLREAARTDHRQQCERRLSGEGG